LNNSYIKQSRIITLWRLYIQTKGDYEATYQRALQMGVTGPTAKGYMDNILSRVDKLNNNNNKALNK